MLNENMSGGYDLWVFIHLSLCFLLPLRLRRDFTSMNMPCEMKHIGPNPIQFNPIQSDDCTRKDSGKEYGPGCFSLCGVSLRHRRRRRRPPPPPPPLLKLERWVV